MRRNTDKLLKLTFAVLALSLIFIIKSIISSNINSSKKQQPFSSMKKDDIREIGIYSDTKQTKLYLKNKVWFLKTNDYEYKADQTRIEELLTNILSLEKTDIVSNNINNYKDLGIDKQKITIK
jgi:hypothetical protein